MTLHAAVPTGPYDRPIRRGDRLAVKHTTRWTRAVVREIRYRLDVNIVHRHEGVEALALNEIGRVVPQVTTPLMYESYRRSGTTGSYNLVDEATDGTFGAGMMLDAPGGHSS